jgi:hypothetical protein
MAVSPSSPSPQPSDTELRRLVAELQAVMQQRPDLLEIVIPKAGAPRVRQQVVVETEWK